MEKPSVGDSGMVWYGNLSSFENHEIAQFLQPPIWWYGTTNFFALFYLVLLWILPSFASISSAAASGAVFIAKKEHIFGKNVSATKAQFCDNGRVHDLVIECDTIHVKCLHSCELPFHLSSIKWIQIAYSSKAWLGFSKTCLDGEVP
ncbi:hypothetical protein CQW23_23693 [Capsicum baccatum]|uniref:Uncharacterized protein n=1 Tax=Capsicum baccatum TaxID=33114 RepID=A0A2G2VSS2_CAPBA|nr:hypothetical protein CQW23_23693 [Capsicum baccatum]